LSDQREGEFAFVVVAAVLLLLVLIGGGLAFLLWQRTAMTQRVAEMARLEAEQQRALAEKQLAEKSDAVIVDADSTSGNAPTSTKEIAAIEGVLLAQQAAWNEGDIDAFMETYWKSDELTFSSSGSTTRSWQSTIARYKSKYPTREAMGKLSFSDLQVQLLAPDAAYVLGRWDLKDKARGNFTLIMKKLSSGWVIVHDHTSLD
jgi:ketosteroid isomerase-like protein